MKKASENLGWKLKETEEDEEGQLQVNWQEEVIRAVYWLKDRKFGEMAFTVGIGGPAGSRKTTLVMALCKALAAQPLSLAVVVHDPETQSHLDLDVNTLVDGGALP
ncbi:hypothetical protein CCACVL1_11474 [Corchorus capsularis]|uniref:Uncharacterized protein n=1 Tax=Corchorus capsularis TaxID=210143 RepID=A0A1R3IKY4_COCAP|nr:hypothetical protein CCACVL1_11474 [Corchorus capsularis]